MVKGGQSTLPPNPPYNAKETIAKLQTPLSKVAKWVKFCDIPIAVQKLESVLSTARNCVNNFFKEGFSMPLQAWLASLQIRLSA